MGVRELLEQRLSLPGDSNQHLPSVVRILRPGDEAAVDKPVEELDGAVMTQLKPLGPVRSMYVSV